MQDTSRDIMSQAAALLIARGYTREWAEEVLRSEGHTVHPESPEEWVDQILHLGARPSETRGRQQVLEEHHRHGIPPLAGARVASGFSWQRAILGRA